MHILIGIENSKKREFGRDMVNRNLNMNDYGLAEMMATVRYGDKLIIDRSIISWMSHQYKLREYKMVMSTDVFCAKSVFAGLLKLFPKSRIVSPENAEYVEEIIELWNDNRSKDLVYEI